MAQPKTLAQLDAANHKAYWEAVDVAGENGGEHPDPPAVQPLCIAVGKSIRQFMDSACTLAKRLASKKQLNERDYDAEIAAARARILDIRQMREDLRAKVVELGKEIQASHDAENAVNLAGIGHARDALNRQHSDFMRSTAGLGSDPMDPYNYARS